MAASLRRFAQFPPGSGLTRMGCMIDMFSRAKVGVRKYNVSLFDKNWQLSS